MKEESGNYRIRQQIRDMVTFAPHDLVKDAPFTRLDILVCRNVLIYLETELQRRLIPLFHYSLNPGGILVLGSAETVGSGAAGVAEVSTVEGATRAGGGDFQGALRMVLSLHIAIVVILHRASGK